MCKLGDVICFAFRRPMSPSREPGVHEQTDIHPLMQRKPHFGFVCQRRGLFLPLFPALAVLGNSTFKWRAVVFFPCRFLSLVGQRTKRLYTGNTRKGAIEPGQMHLLHCEDVCSHSYIFFICLTEQGS